MLLQLKLLMMLHCPGVVGIVNLAAIAVISDAAVADGAAIAVFKVCCSCSRPIMLEFNLSIMLQLQLSIMLQLQF